MKVRCAPKFLLLMLVALSPGYAAGVQDRIGAAAAELLVEERKIAGLGVDTASIDNGPSKEFLVHRITAAANVFGLENLTLPAQELPVGFVYIDDVIPDIKLDIRYFTEDNFTGRPVTGYEKPKGILSAQAAAALKGVEA